MSHVRHYWVLLWATGPLTSLESIAEAPDRQAAKMGKLSIFWLLLPSITIPWQYTHVPWQRVKLLQRSKHHFTTKQKHDLHGNLVLTLSLSRHSPIVSFSVICCMASGLDPAKSRFFAKFWLIPSYLINHNFEHNQLYDLQFTLIVGSNFHVIK